MLYSEIIAVCSQLHTKHINTMCGQNLTTKEKDGYRHLPVQAPSHQTVGVGPLSLSLASICNSLAAPSLMAQRVSGLPKRLSLCPLCLMLHVIVLTGISLRCFGQSVRRSVNSANSFRAQSDLCPEIHARAATT